MNNKLIFTLLIFCFSSFSSFSQGVQASFNKAQFYSPVDGTFLETYISIYGKSVVWKSQPNSKKQAEVLISLLFVKNGKVVSFSKETLQSPSISDTSNTNFDFIQVKRFALDTGKYKMILKLDDVNDTIKETEIFLPIEIKYSKEDVEISGIQAVASYKKSESNNILTKGNLDMVPYIHEYYPVSINQIMFYSEVYNVTKKVAKDEPLLLLYSVKNHENDQIVSSLNKFERRNAADILPCFVKFDISNLPSGNYDIVIEVRDKLNNLHATQASFFTRDNPLIMMTYNDLASVVVQATFIEHISSADTLIEIVNSFAPISSGVEKSFADRLVKERNVNYLQQYILNFWTTRNPINPELSFQNYMIEVGKVQREYGSRTMKGYMSDRGRVYLQYGAPNSINKNYQESSAYPYEIWHYYAIKNQSNRKFVFYNTDLASNNFELLHSDALGEANNYQWRLFLRKRDSVYRSIDETGEDDDIWGSKYNEYFQNPR